MSSDTSALRAAIDHVAHLLPAQGPISVFIHHNVLHAFEESRFEDAVVEAARIYGAQAYWPAEAYRAQFETGRITNDELSEVIDEALGLARANESIGDIGTRREVAFVVTRYGVPDIRGQSLDWHLHEEGALLQFRKELPPAAHAAIAATGAATPAEVARVLQSLWDACVSAIGKSAADARPAARPFVRRHRDIVLDATGVDIDDDVDNLVVRFVSAYLNQGLALWSMPIARTGSSLPSCMRTTTNGWPHSSGHGDAISSRSSTSRRRLRVMPSRRWLRRSMRSASVRRSTNRSCSRRRSR